MKVVWPWVIAVALSACGEPQKGGVRGLLGAPDGGAPSGKTCRNVVCDPNATCAGTGDDAKCTCLPGYQGDGEHCDDVDECQDQALSGCNENADCINRPGKFLCKCKSGFLGDGKTCEDVNECSGVANVCDRNAVCVNRDQGFGCECNPGFFLSGADGNACGDVDECADAALYSCAQSAHCENTFGGYDCRCDAGFVGNGNTACQSLCDAARGNTAVCGEHGLCRVDGAAAVCDACEPGFVGDGKSCAAQACAAACDGAGTDDADHAVCRSDGTCACAPGYDGAPGGCADVDECATDNGGCGDHADCTNVDGGHLCACKPGFERDSAGNCVDVDECARTPGPCHPDATCTNQTPDGSPGAKGYSCACKPGFTGDGTVCADVNECATDNGGCAAKASCVNQRGTFACECAAPLVGDPDNCHCDLSGVWAMRQDVDTCWKGRPIQEGTSQDLVSPGNVEATVWELFEISYDGDRVDVSRRACGSDHTPDLISPLFRETYSAYIPPSVFDHLELEKGASFTQRGLVQGSRFTTPREAALTGIDLGADPVNAPWPPSYTAVDSWVDTDGDGEPGLTLWPRLPSEPTQSGEDNYSYLPARPGIGGTTFYIDQRAGCVSIAARVITHLEAQVDETTCERITGTVRNDRTEGRVHSCTLVPKGTCNPNDQNDCSGWHEAVTCNASDWTAAQGRCSDEDLIRLDSDQNQAQDSEATFELVKLEGSAATCEDVKNKLPAIERPTVTISCTTPP